MRFRFTLLREAVSIPFITPLLSEFGNTGTQVFSWTIGSTLTVNLNGTGLPFGMYSKYAYLDYDFIIGYSYHFEIDYTRVVDVVGSDGSTIELRISDSLDSSQFSAIESPGSGGTLEIDFIATADCTRIIIQGFDGSDITLTITALRATGYNPLLTSSTLQIDEPDGWKDATLKLTRDKDFHSLVEYFDGSFIFYGKRQGLNGGLFQIKEWEREDGPDASIGILIEYTRDGYNFFQVFIGQLDISLAEELVDNKMRIPIIRTDFWAKFMARKDTPVDLQALVDLDGADIIPVNSIDLVLPTQPIPKTYRAEEDTGVIFLVNDEYFQYQPYDLILEELPQIYELPRATNSEIPAWIFEPDLDGETYLNFRIEYSLVKTTVPDQGFNTPRTRYDWFYQKNDETPIEFTYTPASYTDPLVYANWGPPETPTPPGDDLVTTSIATFSTTIFLNKHDTIKIYLQRDTADNNNIIVWGREGISDTIPPLIAPLPDGMIPIPTFFEISQQTVFETTICQSFLVHDSAAAILKSYGLGVENPFYSEIFGGTQTLARQYDTEGCYWNHANAKGVHVRGYSLAEKIYSMSFNQWWKGIYPIFNVGLTYETIEIDHSGEGGEEIQILDNPEFVDSSVWTQDLTGTSWTVGGGHASVSLASLSDQSKRLSQIFGTFGPGIYQVVLTGTLALVMSDGLQVEIAFYNGATFVDSIVYSLFASSNGPIVLDSFDSFELTVPVDRIYMTLTCIGGSTVSADWTSFFVYATVVAPINETVDVIRVESVEEFYDEEFILKLSNIRQISRNYDTDLIYNKIEIGYTEWKAEAISGIDDPQTKHTYATRFEKIGQSIELLSDWIAASIPWEETRRQSITKTKDYKFDDNTFIVRLNTNEVSPDSYVPEFDERFNLVTNLFNSDRRYNIGLSVARNFLRFRKWFNGCLQSYLGSVYRFVNGEGNYKMSSQMLEDSPSCSDEDYDGLVLTENQNIGVTDEVIHLINHYVITHPMSMTEYQKAAKFRKKAIGISLTSLNHKAFFIEDLGFKPVKGSVSITGWTKEFFDIRTLQGPAPTQTCIPTTACDNALTDTFEEILTDENGVCLTF